MPRKKPNGYITSGVNFEPDVLAYLEKLCEADDRSRSHIVNMIIKDYAARHKEDVLPGFENFTKSA